MDRQCAKSLNVAAAGILAGIAAGGTEATGGQLYAGLMSSGYSFVQYQEIMGALQGAGLVQRHTLERYTLTDKGREMNAKVSAAIAAHAQRAAA